MWQIFKNKENEGASHAFNIRNRVTRGHGHALTHGNHKRLGKIGELALSSHPAVQQKSIHTPQRPTRYEIRGSVSCCPTEDHPKRLT